MDNKDLSEQFIQDVTHVNTNWVRLEITGFIEYFRVIIATPDEYINNYVSDNHYSTAKGRHKTGTS